MLKAQEDARQLLRSNPLVADCVGKLLKHTTAPLEVEWGKIKLGLEYELSPTLSVTGRELKEAIEMAAAGEVVPAGEVAPKPGRELLVASGQWPAATSYLLPG
jgi:hypothetical protein